MARVYQRPSRGPEWWLDYTDNFGKRHQVKTTTTSKRKAEDLLAEVVTQFKRQQLGLEIAPSSKVKTLGEAWEMWLKNWCTEAMLEVEQYRYDGNVRGSWIASMDLTEIDGDMIEKWLKEKMAEPRVAVVKTKNGRFRKVRAQTAVTVNGHRRVMRLIFNKLIKKRLFRGVNPVWETTKEEENPKAKRVLTGAEFERVVAHLPADWKDVCRVAFYTGLRRGELYALRKDRSVVDLELQTLTPRASNKRSQVKGKAVKAIPILPEALEPLRRAWNAAKFGDLLFPGKDGEMRTRHLRPADLIKSAMARAGLVEGWLHVCRWGCKVEEKHADEQRRPCPSCTRILYPKAVVAGVTFHGLRHSNVTNLLRDGVGLAHVSRLARHADTKVTEGYAHLIVEDLRDAVAAKDVRAQIAALESRVPPDVADLLSQARAKLGPNSDQPRPNLALVASTKTRKRN